MLISRKCALLACAALTAGAFAGGARAQQATGGSPPAQTPAAQNAAQNAAQSGAQNNQVQEVIVTATRRSERVQNVAGEVTALSGRDLSQMNAHTFNDFATSVPGLSFQSNSPTNNLIAIRGVASSTAELGSGVGIYLDDVPLGASTQFGLGSQSFNFSLFDMDRVEVLNGPQGTLYGANALGGALKYVTDKPEFGVYDAQAEVEGSSTAHGGDNGGLRAMVNIPLFGDNAALRIDGLQSYDSGYTQDPDHDRKDVGSAWTNGGRVSFDAHVTPDLEVRLTALTQNIAADGQNVAFINPTTHAPMQGAYDQSYDLSQPEDNSVTLYSGTINWDLHWGKLTSVTAYQRIHGSYQSDVSPFYDAVVPIYASIFDPAEIPATATAPYDLAVDTNTNKFSQELRLASPDNKHLEWVVGAYYTREVTDERVNLLDAASPSGDLPAPFSSYPFAGYLPSTYTEIAGFGDVTWYINSRFDVTLGVRYSQQYQDYSSEIGYIGFGPPYGKIYDYSSTSDQGVATYLFNPRFHLTQDVMLYARVSSGYRPGGPNFVLPGASSLPPTFQPDKLWNYELGEKSTFLNHKATFNFDVYDIEWTGIQTTDNVNGINQLVNAGNARIQGMETSFSYRVAPRLTLSGSAAYTDAQLTTEAPVLDVLYTDARLPVSPKYNFALNAAYRFELGPDHPGTFNVSDVWVGDRTSGYAGSATNILFKLPAYNTVNLNASLRLTQNVELAAYVKNVFDVQGELSADTLNNTVIPTSGVPVALSLPRTVGLVLKFGLGR